MLTPSSSHVTRGELRSYKRPRPYPANARRFVRNKGQVKKQANKMEERPSYSLILSSVIRVSKQTCSEMPSSRTTRGLIERHTYNKPSLALYGSCYRDPEPPSEPPRQSKCSRKKEKKKKSGLDNSDRVEVTECQLKRGEKRSLVLHWSREKTRFGR